MPLGLRAYFRYWSDWFCIFRRHHDASHALRLHIYQDAVIKELTAAAHISSTADAKRIAELQDILKRKNMVISKLKKDMSALKQMVVELTRAKRAFSVNLNTDSSELPVMSCNILYDMSSTSPSSSYSQSPVTPREYLTVQPISSTPGDCESRGSSRVSVPKTSLPPAKSSGCNLRSTIPFKEKSLNPKVETSLAGSRQKQLISSTGDFKKIRRQSQPDSRKKATEAHLAFFFGTVYKLQVYKDWGQFCSAVFSTWLKPNDGLRLSLGYVISPQESRSCTICAK